MRIAILRFENLPRFVTWEVPDMDELFEDENLLIAEFERQGHEAYSIVWSDKSVDWNEFNIAIIRSTWDYIDRPEEFLKVLTEIDSSSCKLYNPLKAVRWNSNKNYMFDLQKWNVPIVPTYRAAGCDFISMQKLFEKNNWSEAILKPVIGGGGNDVHRIGSEEIQSKYKMLNSKQPDQEYLIQPLIDSILTEGEWSYVYAGGELIHVLLKKPAEGDYRIHEMYGGSVEIVQPGKEDLLQANSILPKLPFDLLYARLDLVRRGGKLVVMEIELIEPVLFFNLAPEGTAKMVNAAIDKAGQHL